MRPKRIFLFALTLIAFFAFSSPVFAGVIGNPSGDGLELCLFGIAGAAVLTVKELLEKRTAALDEIKTIEKTAADETRDLSEEEETRCDSLLDEAEAHSTEIEKRNKQSTREKRRLDLEKRTADPGKPPRGPEPNTDDPNDPVTNVDSKRYSILRAIRRRAAGKPLDGYEAEVSQEIEKRSGREATGFFMPSNLQVETRDLDTTTGVGVLQTATLRTMIELLRNRMFTRQLGAQVLTDMVGDFDIPKQTGAGSAYWVTEGNAPTESSQAIGQVAFSPSTVGAFSDYTRKFIKQTGLDAENFLRNDLTRVLALELDRVGLNGSGTGAEPEGIGQNASVPTVPLGTNGLAPTHAMIVQLETEISQDNADISNLAYLTTAQAKGKCKQVEKASGTAQFLWENSELNGYPAFASQQLPANLSKGTGSNLSMMIFGDWSSLIYALWGAVDILVDPYTASSAGTVRVVALQDADVQLRRTESFSKSVDIVTT